MMTPCFGEALRARRRSSAVFRKRAPLVGPVGAEPLDANGSVANGAFQVDRLSPPTRSLSLTSVPCEPRSAALASLRRSTLTPSTPMSWAPRSTRPSAGEPGPLDDDGVVDSL